MAKIPEFVMQSYRYTERQSESAPAKMKAAAAQAEGAQAVNQAAARAPAEMPASPPLAQASVSPQAPVSAAAQGIAEPQKAQVTQRVIAAAIRNLPGETAPSASARPHASAPAQASAVPQGSRKEQVIAEVIRRKML